MSSVDWQGFLDQSLNYIKCCGLYREFTLIKSRKERVKFVKNQKFSDSVWLDDWLEKQNQKVNRNSKCDQKAEEFRLQGNQAFKGKNFMTALHFYNKSVCWSEHLDAQQNHKRERQLPIAIANRSAVLFHLKKYKACIEDIDRAVSLDYPKENSAKLILRKAHACFYLGRHSKAKQVLSQLRNDLETWSLPADKTKSVQMEVSSLEEKLLSCDSCCESSCGEPVCPSPVHGHSQVLVQASKAIDLCWQENKGRHLVVGVAHLALRIILTAGLPVLLNYDNTDRGEPSPSTGLTDSGTYERNYLTVYGLMPHDEHISHEDLFQYSMTAALLQACLQQTDFFKEFLSEEVCQKNHTICDSTNEPQQKSSQLRIDADKNLSEKDTLVVRLLKDVQRGEQIFNCYGPHCKRMTRNKRQTMLREQYFFNCSCAACENEDDLEALLQACRCSACSAAVFIKDSTCIACPHCHHEMDTKEVMVKVERARQYFINGLCCLERNDPNGAVKQLKSCLALREKLLYKYNKDLAECRDALARCYAIVGKFAESANLLESTLAHTKFVYGEESIELANEYQKYAEILVNTHKMPQALQVTRDAVRIFEKNYGWQCKPVQELVELQDNIKKATLH